MHNAQPCTHCRRPVVLVDGVWTHVDETASRPKIRDPDAIKSLVERHPFLSM